LKRLSFLFLLLSLFPSLCFAQTTGAHRVGQVIVKGNGIAANVGPNAKILVCVLNTGCATAANIYLDAGLTTPARNPVTADGSGNYDYYIASGCVDEQISSPGQGIIFVPNVCPFNGQGGGGGRGTVDGGTAGQVAQYPSSGTTVTGATMSKDATMAVGGAVTVSSTNGVPFAPSATTDTTNANNITSGTLPVPRGGTGAGTLTGYLKGNGTSPFTASPTVPSSDLTYPTATINQVWQYSSPTTMGPGGFLARLDLANCSTAYLFNASTTGTTATNLCATGSAGNGTIIGSPAVTQFGLALNPNGATGMAVQLPASENTAKTFLIAGYFPSFGTNYGINWGDGSTGFGLNGSTLCGTVNTLMCFVSQDAAQEPGYLADSFYTYWPGAARGLAVAAQSRRTGTHVIGITCDTGSGAQYYVDGVPMVMAAHSAVCPTTTGSGIYQVGGSALVTGGWKSMLLSASMSFQSALSNSQMAQQSTALLNYMLSAGQTNTPTPAATTSGVGQLTCVGDSRTAGVIGPAPCTWVVLDDTTALISIKGYSGERAYDLCADPNYQGIQNLPRNSAHSLAIVWIDVNDIDTAGHNPTNIASYDACIVKNLKATGASVYITTEVSSCAVAWGDSDKNAINPMILALAKQWGADGVLALGSFPILGADGASANTTYFNGCLHPTTLANQTVVAVAYSNAANELWGSTANNYNEITATTYQELAKDGFLRMNAPSAATVTLPDCQGYTKPRTIYNASAFTVTVNPSASGFYASFSETIDGGSSTTIPAGTTKVFGIIQGPPSAGTCDWQTL